MEKIYKSLLDEEQDYPDFDKAEALTKKQLDRRAGSLTRSAQREERRASRPANNSQTRPLR